LFAGKETIHQLYGTRIAVLAGDFMFAQSSWFLANLENIEVIKLISQVPMGSSILHSLL
jgi:all-trans-nonaprenyl-diphosphate synthase